MTIREAIRVAIEEAVQEIGGEQAAPSFSVEVPPPTKKIGGGVPENREYGDYATNAALVLAKVLKRSTMEVAGELVKKLADERWEVSVANPGFLNFRLAHSVARKFIGEILEKKELFGRNSVLAGKKVIVEYTDPNPFKEFHIGHLMSNTIGESISRIVEFSGAEVKRVNYQGDVGIHVAKAVWAMKEQYDTDSWQVIENEYDVWAKGKWMGFLYAGGSSMYDNDQEKHDEIIEINKKIYDRSDPFINELYDKGREWSLEYFEEIYKRFGTKFDEYFFESETGERGRELVEEGLLKGIFEKSDGAVVFRGEKYGLHTRVFINSTGLPTYEAKELGLAVMKYERYPYDLAFVVTGNEIVEYFKVVKAALRELRLELTERITHIPHGMLRLKGGKMSSRTGDVIRALDVLREAKGVIKGKIKDEMNFSDEQKEEISEQVALGALKYSILHQSVGKDIIFDFETSLSFDGDSGPYLQYTYARAKSILRKAGIKGSIDKGMALNEYVVHVERELLHFPDAVAEALQKRDPHFIAHYLFNLAQKFNTFYGNERILEDKIDVYKLAITEAVAITLKNGLNLLGIEAPEEM